MIFSALLGLLLVPYISCQSSEAYFNGTSFVLLSSKISPLGRTSFSFRTCQYQGTLVSQRGGLGDFLAVNLTKEQQLRLTWSVQGHTKFLQLGRELVDNQWHDVELVYRADNLTLSVDNEQALVASNAHNAEILHINFQSSRVLVGENFVGCILQGPGLEFVSPKTEFSNVRWGQCPLPLTKNCDGYLQNPCFGDPCQNGDCIPKQNFYTCQCWPNYFGNHCNHFAGPRCDRSSPCENGATCMDNRFGNSTICLCPPSFTGPKCETFIQNNFCVPNTCLNGGACNVNQTRKGFECNCQAGFAGERCEKNIDDCLSSPCLNNGECIDQVAGYFCNCTGTGYEGDRCQINVDECSLTSNVCPAGNKCFDRYGSYTCQNSCVGIACPPNSHCVQKLSSSSCACDPGYSGSPPNCTPLEMCINQPCYNGGSCHDGVLGFKCACASGFTGPRCEKLANCTCVNGVCPSGLECEKSCEDVSCPNGTCVNGTCVCPPGLTGEHCELDVDECKGNPCNHGICQNLHGSFLCYCQPGFTGQSCNIEFNECLSSPCQNGATCMDQVNNYMCLCLPGFAGPHCDINIDECASNPCQHDGTCLDEVNGYKCDCLPGFTGLNCEVDIDECASIPCLNHGNCLDLQNGYSCNCTDTGFTGPSCNINEDDCGPNPCQNGATCKDLIKGYKCQCYEGYEGVNCEIDIQECSSSPCHNDALCFEKSNETLYKMDYLGLFSQFSYDNASGFVCVCPTGFAGLLCETNIDDCLGHSCDHGTCVDGINNYLCSCFPGYEGQNCSEEINECETLKPCQNNAPCTDKVNDYACHCPENVGGKNCDIQLIGCHNHECENNAPCRPFLTDSGAHSYQCICPLGFKGKLCDISTTLSFQGQGYWEPIITGNSSSYQLEFWFRTTLPNVILSYGTNIFNTIGYTLALYEGRVELFLYDSFNRTIANMSSAIKLNNAFWNHLTLSIISRDKVILNTTQTYLERPLMEELLFINTKVGGGHSSIPNFIGCIQEIQFDKMFLLPLQGRSKNVEVGCERQEQCLPTTCSHNGVCEDQWIKHHCSCQRPYFGDNCTYSHIPATYGYKDVVSWSTVLIPMQDATNLSNTLDASFFLKTRKSTGLLFQMNHASVNSTMPEDYFSQVTALLEDSRLNVILKPSQGNSFNFSMPTFLSDGEFHFIRISRRYSELEIITDEEQQIFPIPNLPLKAQVLYIGALPPSSRAKRSVSDFFKGVIQDFRLNDSPVIFFPLSAPGRYSPSRLRVINSYSVMEGSKSDFNCSEHNPCQNGGVCDDVKLNEYKCVCHPDFRGKDCEEQQPCTLNPCPANTKCQNLDDGSHECLATIALNNNQLKYSFINVYPISNLSLKYRSIDSGTLLETNVFSVRLEGQNIIFVSNGRQMILERPNYREEQELLITFRDKTIAMEVPHSTLLNEMDSQLDSKRPEISRLVLGYHNLRACLSDVKLNNLTLPFFKESNNTLSRNILEFDQQTAPQVGCVLCWNQDCLENTSCEDPVNSFECHCPEYLSGRFCEHDVCSSDTQPCQNGGRCYVDDERIHCNCSKDYIGSRCEKENPFCSENKCQNGATCDDATKSCKCPELFDGEFCEYYKYDSCRAKDCLNNAPCINIEGRDECECSSRFSGAFCERQVLCYERHDLCNKGSCEDAEVGFLCHCDEGFYGEDCNIQSPCNEKSCSQQGNCTVLEAAGIYIHKCECFEGYIGDSCEKDNAFILLVIIPIVVVIIAAVLIGSALFVRNAKKKRATRGTYSPSRQEMYGSRVEMNHVMKPPPEERLI